MQLKLRADEELIRQRVESYLRGLDPAMQVAAHKPDPPDCYALSNGRRIPLEITRAEVGNLTHVNSLFDLISGINPRYRDFASDYCLGIHIVGPVDNPRRFKKALEDLIARFVSDPPQIACKEFYDFRDVNGERVMITKSRRENGQDFLLFSVGDKDHVASCLIQDETDAIYSCTIIKKDRAMAAIEGEKWLAIYNGYPLAEEHNIREALAKLAGKHSFTRIFVVNGNDVFEIANQSSNSACKLTAAAVTPPAEHAARRPAGADAAAADADV
jgi:hypothetical protein